MIFHVENFAKPRSVRFFQALGAIVVLLFASPTLAQVTSDGTVGTLVTTSSNTATITGGTQVGNNLFHSFSEFSLTLSSINTAKFDNRLEIQNIITRVTGGSVSAINGLIEANGSANLFFLNPNGIVFGEQATLRIGGSFVASTANSLKFADGGEFNTIASSPPLLSIGVPIGLQYGANPGSIQVQGSGNNLYVNPSPFEIIRSFRPTGLAVEPGKTLALIGGSVELLGGNLTAEQGRIDIGAVANSTVFLTPTASGWKVTYPTNASFQNVTFAQAASADVSGNGGGQIRVQGQDITVSDGSSLLALTLGDGAGGEVTLNATGAVTVAGENPLFPSSLLTEVSLGATGQGGNITVNAGRLLAADGAKISVSTSGDGNGGQLTVNTPDVEIRGASPNFGSTLFAADSTGGAGNGGQILIHAGQLRVTEGGGISASTTGSSSGGLVQIQAKTVEFVGGSPLVGASGLFATTFPGSTGQGGNVLISADRFRLAEGAQVVLDTYGAGNTGNLQLLANSLEVVGTSPGGDASQLSMQVRAGATGNGGVYQIQANRLAIAQGGLIQAVTSGDGHAGSLAIKAQEISLTGFGSGIFMQVAPNSNGDAGSLAIETERLFLAEGAQIGTSTAGIGNAGALTIQAQEIELRGALLPAPTGIFAAVSLGGTGQGAELQITTQRLRVLDGAQIAADTLSSGNAGTLTVKAQDVELVGFTLQGSSGLFAGTIVGSGAGGDINLVSDRLTIRDGATISASNFPSQNIEIPTGQGAAGDIRIQSNSIRLNSGRITASTATGGKGNIDLRSHLLTLENNSLITTNSQGIEPGGNIQINTDFLVGYRNSDITANAVNARGGQVTVTAEGIFGIAPRDRLTPQNDITATSELGVAFNGVVQINAPNVDPARGLDQLPDLIDHNHQIVATCEPAKRNTLVITGRGGLPEDASQPLRGGTVWEDLRSPLKSQTVNTQILSAPDSAIVEAQSWVTNANGQVELIAISQTNLPDLSRNVQCAAQR
jgi:filamentous hemagglutinin family protein